MSNLTIHAEMSDPKQPLRSPSYLPARAGGFWAIAFVVGSLLALAIVPVFLGRESEHTQRRIVEVLEPARALATRLALIQARQMSRFQAFLLTGNRSYEKPYQEAHQAEIDTTAVLNNLVQNMDLKVRERLANLSTLSMNWYVGHVLVFKSEPARQRGLANLASEEAQYDRLQRAALELQGAIEADVEAGRQRMQHVRTLQTIITMVLALLGLGATLVVGAVGVRLQRISAESETRRRDAQRARREIDALMDATSDGVLGIDLEGRCTFLNRAGCELLGYSEWEIRGRDVHDTIHHARPDGSRRPRDKSPILAALRTNKRARSPDGDVLWRRRGEHFQAQWTLRPLVDGTEVRGAVLTFTDMTEIREKEAALRRAVRSREEVVSIVSHDLRNPLGVVAAAADLILELPLSEAERKNQAEIIRRSATRMGRLIEDLLDVARIEAGALRVRTEVQDPGDVLEEIRTVFAPQAVERGIRLEIEAGSDVPHARMDRDRVIQALTNLLDNALRFTPEGGRVTVSTSRKDGGVAFSVSDTGPGIAEQALAHLFDRFWRGERNDRKGAGLGLAIVRGIAEAQGGSVEVESRPGEGATFTLRLPTANASEPTPA